MASKYREDLRASFKEFRGFATRHGVSVKQLRRRRVPNRELVAYVQHLYDSRAPLRDARYAVPSVQEPFRDLEGKLKPIYGIG